MEPAWQGDAMKRWLFFGLAMILPGVLLAMVTLGAQAHVGGAMPMVEASGGIADLAITQHTDSPDPVVGTNTVQYEIVVKNFGPSSTDMVGLDINQNGFSSGSFHTATLNSGDIVAVQGQGWTCSIGESPDYATCDMGALGVGDTAPPVFVWVRAPNFDTVITNTASVYSNAITDPNPDNDSSSEDTTVVVNNECGPGVVSCGTGHIDYGRNSTVSTGATPTPGHWLVGTAYFRGTPGASGGQTWSMYAPTSSKCIAINCTFAMVLDNIPNPYHRGDVAITLSCDPSHCKKALVPGAGLVMIKFDALGLPHLLPRCISLVTVTCFKATWAPGYLYVTVKNLSAGDPRLAGLCIGGGC